MFIQSTTMGYVTGVLLSGLFVMVFFTEQAHAMPRNTVAKRQDLLELNSDIEEIQSDIDELRTNQQELENAVNTLNMSIIGPGPPQDDLRLVDGASQYEGRVEVYYNGYWGTVCDDRWNDDDAEVVCRQLGYSGGISRTNAHFGQGSGHVWMDDILCDGSESRLQDCNFNGWGNENCHHGEDAGVECNDPDRTTIEPARSDQAAIRLVDGPSDSAGRLEVFHDGVWGTVCDDSFDRLDVRVACRQLGYSENEGQRVKKFGQGSGRIWLDNVECAGEEAALSECSSNDWGIENCQHHEDVGIVCVAPNTTESPVVDPRDMIRLVGGETAYEGRVEFYLNGEWGTVCDDYWNTSTARVACRQLGFRGGVVHSSAYFGPGSGPTQLDDVKCGGDESNLLDCSHFETPNEDCHHGEDVGVTCESPEGTPTTQWATELPQTTPVSMTLLPDVTGTSGTACDMMSVMRCSGYLSDISADTMASTDGLRQLCSVNYPRFVECVENLPISCINDEQSRVMAEQRATMDGLCASSSEGGCSVMAYMSCMEIIAANQPDSMNFAALCSSYPQFQDCLNNLPASCSDDTTYNESIRPTQAMLQSLCL
ncbi:deleted in malignant brain tumors 1 protein-like [Ylistrum balloti]|uniref:deleted in malignant brain tumors 1 protein-like n=1 Tax=Ylistrum balloti TaxID=509963 RepID=UPI00290596BB|nr:deleted in malignant brain tumors 1 protein-like [Ylistrum balloti]